ncbi:MAG: hypothetical protein AAF844_02680 [Pseudomonadota bacterium]
MNRRDARLTDVLEPVRDLTVSELLEAMARTLDAGHDVHAEPKARNPAGQPLREGRLALPCRHDLLVRHPGGTLPREVQGGGILRFEPITIVEPEGFVCVIGPFRWDAVHVLVEEAARPATLCGDPREAGSEPLPSSPAAMLPEGLANPAEAESVTNKSKLEAANDVAGGTGEPPKGVGGAVPKNDDRPPAAKFPLTEAAKNPASRAKIELGDGSEPDWRPLRRWFLEWFQSRFADEAPDLDGAVHSVQGPDRVPGGWRLRIDLGSAPVDAVSALIEALEATGAHRVRIGEPN